MKAPDLLRRFTPTPLSTDLCLLGRAVRLETNSAGILEQARRAFAGYGQPLAGKMDFLWRFVSESSDQSRAVPSTVTVIKDADLLFVNLDRHGFIAADGKEREAVGFLEDNWGSAFLPALLWVVTASALGLTMVSAACLAHSGQGLLVLGPPEAAEPFLHQVVGRLGLRIHARRTVFVEAGSSGQQVWGEFRPEGGDLEQPVAAHLPEGLHHAALCAAKLVGCVWIDRRSPAGGLGYLAEVQRVGSQFELSPMFPETAFSAFKTVPLPEPPCHLPEYYLGSGADPTPAIHFVERVLGRRSDPEVVS
jgi:hypothetical protein